MLSIEAIVYAVFTILVIAAAAYEIYDWKNDNHPFQHMN